MRVPGDSRMGRTYSPDGWGGLVANERRDPLVRAPAQSARSWRPPEYGGAVSNSTPVRGLDFYGRDLAAIHADGFGGIARSAAAEAKARLAPGGRVLDLGCGDGTTAGLLAAAGHQVVGVNRSPAMVALARERHADVDFHVADDRSADLPCELDAVLAIGEVLAYVRGREEALQARLGRLLSLLRPGGLLLFDLPAPDRVADRDQRTWTTGDGWAVLASTTGSRDRLKRDIVTFRRIASGDYRRSDEHHVLELSTREQVVAALAAAGAAEPEALARYASLELPAGLIAYAARRPAPR